MIRKFEVEVVRTDKYIIELDTDVLNEEWQEHYRRYFQEYDDLQEHAEHIAELRARLHSQLMFPGHLEGYGIYLLNGKEVALGENKKYINRAVNVVLVDEDNDIEVHSNEIT